MAGVSPMATVAPTHHIADPLLPYLCGGLAAVAAEMVTFPLDTAKTRQQLQGQVGDRRFSSVRYRGILHTLGTIAREEGMACVYRGLSPALVRQAVYGTVKFGLYYSSKDVARRMVRPQHRDSNLLNLCCAVMAGSTSAALANPTDVIKVRMQSGASGSCRKARHGWSLLSVGGIVYRQEGVRGLWRGGVPTAQRAALVAGVQLPVYDAAKAELLRRTGAVEGASTHLAASLLAGLSACLASNPVDVVRTRMMVQRSSLGLPSVGYHASALRCGLHTVRTEGVLGLYKGFFPAFGRMGPWNVIFFLVYERLQRRGPLVKP